MRTDKPSGKSIRMSDLEQHIQATSALANELLFRAVAVHMNAGPSTMTGYWERKSLKSVLDTARQRAEELVAIKSDIIECLKTIANDEVGVLLAMELEALAHAILRAEQALGLRESP